MKTPHAPTRATTRTQRTATHFACEPLEGRNLMTSLTGAGAMLVPGTAEMGGWNGPNGDHQRPESSAQPGGPGGAMMGHSASDQATTPESADAPGGWTPSIARDGRPDDGRTASAADASSSEPAPGERAGGRFDEAMGEPFGVMGGRGPARDHDSDIPLGESGTRGGSDASGSDSAGSSQLQTDRLKLRTDEQAIRDKSAVTPALLAAVRKSSAAIAAAQTGEPDATALTQLRTDEQAIFGAVTDSTASTDSATTTPPARARMAPPTLSQAQKATLQADHDAILRSQGVSQELIDQLAQDQLAVDSASNVTDADRATLDADHKAIQADLDALFPTNVAPTAVGSASAANGSTADVAVASDPAIPSTPTTSTPTAPPSRSVAAMPPTLPNLDPVESGPPLLATMDSTMSVPGPGAGVPTTSAAMSLPDSAPTNAAQPRMHRHRGGAGGSDAHFLHQVDATARSASRSTGANGRVGGVGAGHARRGGRR